MRLEGERWLLGSTKDGPPFRAVVQNAQGEQLACSHAHATKAEALECGARAAKEYAESMGFDIERAPLQ